MCRQEEGGFFHRVWDGIPLFSVAFFPTDIALQVNSPLVAANDGVTPGPPLPSSFPTQSARVR